MNIKSKFFFNPSYSMYNNQPSYLLFLTNGGIYLKIGNDTERLLQKPTEHITLDNIDDYAASRNFDKVLELTDSSAIIWYNGYELKKSSIKKALEDIQSELYVKMRYKTIPDPDLMSVYSTINIMNG